MNPVPWSAHHGAGAIVTFEGIVRPTEDGQPLDALVYEAYEPMVFKTLRTIGEDLERRHALIGLCVEHSTGRLGVGDCSFRLRIAAPHRKEALSATDEFIDRMKRDVPIWKMAEYGK
jgi:molybdopterin synthase catalytic subunit